MKNTFGILALCCFAICPSFSQKINTSEKDVFAADEIIFYRYDYSHFRLADGNRIDQDIKKFILNWIADSLNSIPEQEMASRTYLGKKIVIYDFDPTIELAKEVKSEDMVSFTGRQIS